MVFGCCADRVSARLRDNTTICHDSVAWDNDLVHTSHECKYCAVCDAGGLDPRRRQVSDHAVPRKGGRQLGDKHLELKPVSTRPGGFFKNSHRVVL